MNRRAASEKQTQFGQGSGLGSQTPQVALGDPLRGQGSATWPSPKTPGSVTANRPAAPNKPNFGPGETKDKCGANKELRRMERAGGVGKTKPKVGSR
jgi:hypothetical protein